MAEIAESAASRIYRHFQANPNREIPLNELREVFPDVNDPTLWSTVSRFMKGDRPNIFSVKQGVYIYKRNESMAEPRNIVSPNVWDHLRKNPNQVLYVRDIASAYGLAEGSVGAALVKMAQKPEMQVFHGPLRGTYIYRPNGPNADIPADPTGVVIPEPKATPGLRPVAILSADGRDSGRTVFEPVEPEPIPEWDDVLPPVKLTLNSEYGKSRSTWEYVGNADKYPVVKDSTGELFVAVPLMQFLTAE
jgi:hypothetical protein